MALINTKAMLVACICYLCLCSGGLVFAGEWSYILWFIIISIHQLTQTRSDR